MSELEAQVGTPEPVDGNGQLDHLVPAGAVVVVEHERAVLAGVGLAAAQADAILRWGLGGGEPSVYYLSQRTFHAGVILPRAQSGAGTTLSVSPSA